MKVGQLVGKKKKKKSQIKLTEGTQPNKEPECIVAYRYLTQSKCINKPETKQRPPTDGTDQVS